MEQKIEMEEDSVQSTSRSSLVALTPAMLAKLENDFTIGGGMGTWSGNRIVFANEKEATPKAAKKKRKLTKTEKKRLRAQGILIGKKGAMLKEIGKRARLDMEKFFAARIYLELFVRVRKDWIHDPKMLQEFGYTEKP